MEAVKRNSLLMLILLSADHLFKQFRLGETRPQRPKTCLVSGKPTNPTFLGTTLNFLGTSENSFYF